MVIEIVINIIIFNIVLLYYKINEFVNGIIDLLDLIVINAIYEFINGFVLMCVVFFLIFFLFVMRIVIVNILLWGTLMK